MILFLLSNFLMVLMIFSFIWEALAWGEVFSGHISLDSLRLVTGIVDKMKLIKIFGSPDPNLIFTASYRQVLRARPLWRWIFGNKILEFFLFFLLWQISWQGTGQGWYSFFIVLSYYILSYLIYRVQAQKVHYQLVHEKLKKYGPESDTGFRFDHLGAGQDNVKKTSFTDDNEDNI